MHSTNFLLAEHSLIRQLYRGRPWRVAIRFIVPGFLLLVLGTIFKVHSIGGRLPSKLGEPTGSTQVGLLDQWNWSVEFLLVLPAIFIGFVLLAAYAERSVERLQASGVLCVKELNAGSAVSIVRDQVSAKSVSLLSVSIFLAMALSYVDTIDLTAGYKYSTTPQADITPYPFEEEDWSVAFQMEKWGRKVVPDETPKQHIPTLGQNLAVVIYAFSLQGLAIFLGFFWLGKIWIFLDSFSRLLGRPSGGLELVLQESDLLKRFGLSALGRIFNTFIGLVVAFQVTVVAHRVQQITKVGKTSFRDYFSYVLSKWNEPTEWLNPSLYRFETADIGTWLLIVGVTLPLIVVCWLPAFRLRRYVERRKLEIADQYNKELKSAVLTGDQVNIVKLKDCLEALQRSSVWPNGDRMGWRLLAIMVILWIGAVSPAFLVALLVGVVLGEFAGRLKSLFGKEDA